MCVFFLIFIYLILAALGLCCQVGFSLVAAKQGWGVVCSSLVAMRGLLIVVASLVAEHGLWGAQAS